MMNYKNQSIGGTCHPNRILDLLMFSWIYIRI